MRKDVSGSQEHSSDAAFQYYAEAFYTAAHPDKLFKKFGRAGMHVIPALFRTTLDRVSALEFTRKLFDMFGRYAF